jgi:hypothetical protein
LAYAEKLYHLQDLFSQLEDSRQRPQIELKQVVGGAFLMMATQMGSLNALEQEQGKPFWERWLGGDLASADTIGRVYEGLEVEGLRLAVHWVYDRLKRNKALKPRHGFSVLIVDGHESSSSYLRCCEGCLERHIKIGGQERIQYYHREVIAMLSLERFPLLLDIEQQRKGEDEVAAAMRLLARVVDRYPRAFQVVLGDALYLRANVFQFLLAHGKEGIAVLKDEKRELWQDVQGLFPLEQPVIEVDDQRERRIWDIEDLESWGSLKSLVRVVRSLETKTCRRQRTKQKETQTSDWMWATTSSADKASAPTVVNLGHDRWLIENRALNEMVTYWHANHLYRHHPNAIIAFWLTLFLALNLFRAFICLNIKPVLRARHTDLYFARLLFAGLHEESIHNRSP